MQLFPLLYRLLTNPGVQDTVAFQDWADLIQTDNLLEQGTGDPTTGLGTVSPIGAIRLLSLTEVAERKDRERSVHVSSQSFTPFLPNVMFNKYQCQIYMLFTGLMRCSRPRAQFLPIRTDLDRWINFHLLDFLENIGKKRMKRELLAHTHCHLP